MTNNNFLWTVLVKTIKLCCLYGFFGSNAFEDLNFAKLFIELKVDLFVFFFCIYVFRKLIFGVMLFSEHAELDLK